MSSGSCAIRLRSLHTPNENPLQVGSASVTPLTVEIRTSLVPVITAPVRSNITARRRFGQKTAPPTPRQRPSGVTVSSLARSARVRHCRHLDGCWSRSRTGLTMPSLKDVTRDGRLVSRLAQRSSRDPTPASDYLPYRPGRMSASASTRSSTQTLLGQCQSSPSTAVQHDSGMCTKPSPRQSSPRRRPLNAPSVAKALT